MKTVHFLENNSIILTQLRDSIPSIDENIKVKGRKGKVLNVNQVNDSTIHINVVFEQVIKKKPSASDLNKKKR